MQMVKQISVQRPSDTKCVQLDATMIALTSGHTSIPSPIGLRALLATPFGLGIVYCKLKIQFLHLSCKSILFSDTGPASVSSPPPIFLFLYSSPPWSSITPFPSRHAWPLEPTSSMTMSLAFPPISCNYSMHIFSRLCVLPQIHFFFHSRCLVFGF